jgi:serine/threonine-protein kinase
VDATGRKLIKVLDFGIAKFQSPNAAGDGRDVTECSVVIGSPSYMAPEQMLDARSVDARADVWSLGVILYVLVSGLKPFTGEQITDVAFAVLTGEHRPLVEVAPYVPGPFAEIVERCLAKRLDDRWPSVVELARALAPFALRPESAPRVELSNVTVQLESALVRSLEDPPSDESAGSAPRPAGLVLPA